MSVDLTAFRILHAKTAETAFHLWKRQQERRFTAFRPIYTPGSMMTSHVAIAMAIMFYLFSSWLRDFLLCLPCVCWMMMTEYRTVGIYRSADLTDQPWCKASTLSCFIVPNPHHYYWYKCYNVNTYYYVYRLHQRRIQTVRRCNQWDPYWRHWVYLWWTLSACTRRTESTKTSSTIITYIQNSHTITISLHLHYIHHCVFHINVWPITADVLYEWPIYLYNEQDINNVQSKRHAVLCVCCGRVDRTLAAKSVGQGHGLAATGGGWVMGVRCLLLLHWLYFGLLVQPLR